MQWSSSSQPLVATSFISKILYFIHNCLCLSSTSTSRAPHQGAKIYFISFYDKHVLAKEGCYKQDPNSFMYATQCSGFLYTPVCLNVLQKRLDKFCLCPHFRLDELHIKELKYTFLIFSFYNQHVLAKERC